jgi:AcrR family transcriptional regulator
MNHSVKRTYVDSQSNPITNTTKAKILEIAIELFSKNGYSGSSIRDITKEVGIKESSLYKHFKNKDEILETIFVNFQIETDKLLPPIEYLDRIVAMMSVKEFLQRGTENFIKHIDDPIVQRIWRIMYTEMFRNERAKRIYQDGIMNRTVDCLGLVFQKMIAVGKMKAVNPRTLAREYQYASVSFIFEYNLLLDEGKSTEEVMEKIKEHVEFFSMIASK